MLSITQKWSQIQVLLVLSVSFFVLVCLVYQYDYVPTWMLSCDSVCPWLYVCTSVSECVCLGVSLASKELCSLFYWKAQEVSHGDKMLNILH